MRRISIQSRATGKGKFRRLQAGATIVELLVGILIGLFVVAAAMGTLAFNQASASLANDTVRMQQDASTLMRIIGRQLRQAGSVPAVEALNPDGTPVINKFEYFGNYPGVVAASVVPASITGTNGVRDQFTVSYANTENIRAVISDCHGNAANAGLAVVRSDFRVTAAGEFQCRGQNGSFQSMVNNVEDLQVWYGVMDNAGNLRYFAANQVTDWAAVRSLQVCIRLVGTAIPNVSLGSPTGGVATPGCLPNQNIADDGRIRRVFRQVFALRNQQ